MGWGPRRPRLPLLGPDGLGKRNAQLDCVRVMPLVLPDPGAPLQHTVKLVDQERHRLVALVGHDLGVQARAENRDVSLGLETGGDTLLGIALQLHPESEDVLLVPEQSFHFFAYERLEGGGQFEMNPGHYQLALVLCIHEKYSLQEFFKHPLAGDAPVWKTIPQASDLKVESSRSFCNLTRHIESKA
jgi:hypothetical protein